MRRVVPCALLPAFSPIFATAPFVQATVTVPVPSSGAVALAATGSYAPKLTGDVVIVQFLFTLALTVIDAVDDCASSVAYSTGNAARPAARIRMRRIAASRTRAPLPQESGPPEGQEIRD